MPHSAHRFHRLFKDAVSFFLSGLLVGSLASCSPGSIGGIESTGPQPTLTLSPSTINLTAGAAGQTASLLLDSAGRNRCDDGRGVRPAKWCHALPGDTFGHSGCCLAADVYGGILRGGCNGDGHVTASSNGQSVSTQASLSIQAAPRAGRLLA